MPSCLMGKQRTPRPGHLHVTTSLQVLNWVKARADAEDVSISELVTRILTAAMDRDRERYSTREE